MRLKSQYLAQTRAVRHEYEKFINYIGYYVRFQKNIILYVWHELRVTYIKGLSGDFLWLCYAFMGNSYVALTKIVRYVLTVYVAAGWQSYPLIEYYMCSQFRRHSRHTSTRSSRHSTISGSFTNPVIHRLSDERRPTFPWRHVGPPCIQSFPHWIAKLIPDIMICMTRLLCRWYQIHLQKPLHMYSSGTIHRSWSLAGSAKKDEPRFPSQRVWPSCVTRQLQWPQQDPHLLLLGAYNLAKTPRSCQKDKPT